MKEFKVIVSDDFKLKVGKIKGKFENEDAEDAFSIVMYYLKCKAIKEVSDLTKRIASQSPNLIGELLNEADKIADEYTEVENGQKKTIS